MKFFITLLLSITICQAFAQTPARITVKGEVRDSSEALPSATVLILNAKDSSLVAFTHSGSDGKFEIKGVKNAGLLLKITSIGYVPYQKNLPISTDNTLDVGVVECKLIASELMEVVIKTAKAPIRFIGDTVEYNAASFKVPPGSTVEDLLRQLPGVDVDADGNIKAQGKDVSRVYVDGKTFFDKDPKAATRNLDAESITTVKVYDEKSEQSKLTGVEDGKKEKVMDLKLKDEYKKGSFGKVSLAGGLPEQYAANGNFNRFNTKQQLSFIGFLNNVNQTGVNWDDYSEFKGQNAWSGDDDVDFGFSSSSSMHYMRASGVPFNNFNGLGFTKNAGIGTNYNYDFKKTKISASYFYNRTRLDLDQQSVSKNILSDASYSAFDTLEKDNTKYNHTASFRLEQMIDSFNTVVFKANGDYNGDGLKTLERSQNISEEGVALNKLNNYNNNNSNNLSGTALAIYRKKFKKKGRALALSGSYNYYDAGTDSRTNSTNVLDAETDVLDILYSLNNNERTVKASALYAEPISKRFFTDFFYNFNQSKIFNDRQTQNASDNTYLNDLSRYYAFENLYNRLGGSVKYAYNGMTVYLGLAGQQIKLSADVQQAESDTVGYASLSKTYNRLVPNFSFSYELESGIRLNFDYNYQIDAPRIGELMPVAIYTNANYREVGNPNLNPSEKHSLSFNINKYSPANMSYIGVNLNADLNTQNISSRQNVTFDSIKGVLVDKEYINVTGGYGLDFSTWYGRPFFDNKLNTNFSINAGYNQTPTYVNSALNNIGKTSVGGRIGMNYNFSAKLMGGVSYNISRNFSAYSIQKELAQQYGNQSVSATLKWIVIPKTFFESNFSWNFFDNSFSKQNSGQAIWNASIRRLLGKKNQFEIRLSAFDIFNQRKGIFQYAYNNIVSTTIAPTLARYFMLGVAFNIKGYDDKIKKNRHF